MELFKLFGTIAVKNAEANSAIDETADKAQSFSQKLSDKFEEVGKNTTKLGAKMSLGLTTPITLIGKKAIQATADFESAMSEVGAISGATGDDLIALENKAKQMGESTKFSASESAEALKYMAMAGWKTGDMLDGLEGIMNLAAASGENLGATSDIVTDALTAFGMKASDSGHFADILATASSNANTNVSMMGETFKYIAPVAGALGFSAEDTALAIGLMANSGIKASQAGTSLRGALTNLVNPTENMIGTMVKLGLATKETTHIVDSGKLQKAQTKVENKTIDMEKAQIKYNEAVAKYGENSSQAETAALNLEKAQNNLEEAIYDLNVTQEGEIATLGINNNLLVDSEGNTKSLREVMMTLRSAFSGLTEEEQAQAAATLFGKEAMSGMLAIVNSGDDDFNKLVSAIDSADGAAKEMADTMNDNLSGQMTLLKSQLEGLAIQFVTLIMPYLKQGVEWLSKVCDWISGLDDGTKKMIITIAAVLAAAGPVLIFVGKIATGIGSVISIGGKLITGITTLIPIIGSLGAPIAIVIAAIAALVAIGVVLYKNWDTIKEKAGEMKEKVVSKVTEMKENVVEGFNNIKERAREKIESLKENTVSKLEEMKNNASEKVDEMKKRISAGFQKLKEEGAEKFRDLKEKWSSKFTQAREKIVDEAKQLKERAGKKIGEFKDAAVEKIESFREGAVDKFRKFGDSAKSVLENVKESGVSGFHVIKEKGLEAVGKLKTDAISYFQDMGTDIADKFGSVAEKIGSIFGNARDMVSKIVSDIKSFFDFDWKLPEIKLPHFNIQWDSSGVLGGLAEKIGLPGLPKLDVDWYQKAMNNPLLMEKPTAFGINARGQVMAGGEAGSEVVSGTQTLMKMISAAVAENNGQICEILNRLYDLLSEYLPAMGKRQLVLDSGVLVGELAGSMNEELGRITYMRGRRN